MYIQDTGALLTKDVLYVSLPKCLLSTVLVIAQLESLNKPISIVRVNGETDVLVVQ